MEAARYAEMLVSYRNSAHHNPENLDFKLRVRENINISQLLVITEL
jgi:hypothetical protein